MRHRWNTSGKLPKAGNKQREELRERLFKMTALSK